jgi:hypothetical protein
MAKLRVTIIDEVRNRRLKVDLPDDVAMEKLLPALAKKLGLPPDAYRLTHETTEQALGGDQTLASFGVREGDVLRLATAREEVPVAPWSAEEEAAPLWQKVPVWGWVGIVVLLLLAVAALAFLAGRGAKPVPTPTVVVRATTPAATSIVMPRPTATPVAPTFTPLLPTATPVPTSTPRPTATPVPPTDTLVPPTATPMPTSTSRPTSTPVLTYYDDNFNAPAFDGKYNAELWSRVEGRALQELPTVEQRDGVLVVSQTSGSLNSFVGLSTEKHSNWLLSDLGYVQARLILDNNFDGETGAVEVTVTSNDTDWNDYDWSLGCVIVMCKAGQFCTYEWDRPRMQCVSPGQYSVERIGAEYSTWHTARIEVDPETVTFHFYFDGYYLDSFTPPNAAELKDDDFHVAVGVYLEPNSSATGYIDDVRIGK